MRTVNTRSREQLHCLAAGFIGPNTTGDEASFSEHGCPVREIRGRAAELSAARQQVPQQLTQTDNEVGTFGLHFSPIARRTDWILFQIEHRSGNAGTLVAGEVKRSKSNVVG